MTPAEEIIAEIAKLEAERARAIPAKRTNVLAKMKANLKFYGFKTTEFKGVLLTCAKRGTSCATKKSVAKKPSK